MPDKPSEAGVPGGLARASSTGAPLDLAAWGRLAELRCQFLAMQGDALVEIHGWLLGVACAVERKRGADPGDADRLIAELRASKGPPSGNPSGLNEA